MNCTNTSLGKLLNKFIDGNLAEEKMEKVEHHIIFDCKKCFEKYQFYLDLKRVITENKDKLIPLENIKTDFKKAVLHKNKTQSQIDHKQVLDMIHECSLKNAERKQKNNYENPHLKDSLFFGKKTHDIIITHTEFGKPVAGKIVRRKEYLKVNQKRGYGFITPTHTPKHILMRAIEYIKENKFKIGDREFKKILSVYHKTGNERKEKAYTFIEWAKAYADIGGNNIAVKKYDKALKILEDAGLTDCNEYKFSVKEREKLIGG